MKCFKALLIVFLLSGCGKAPSVSIDPVFQPYVDRFLEEAHNRHKKVEIVDLDITMVDDITKYTDNGIEANAACVTDHDVERPTIVVSKGFWLTTFEYSKKRTLFHELGHCVLGRKHLDTMTIKDNIPAPASIMATQFNNVSFFIKYYSEYMDELFIASMPDFN